MSAYRDFIKDFPSRCCDVLEYYSKSARMRDREVTLLLMTAAAGFVVPFERLRPTRNGHPVETAVPTDHPLRKALSRKFCETQFGPGSTKNAGWRFGKSDDRPNGDGPWSEMQLDKIEEPECNYVLACVRKALTHGNVEVKSHQGRIEEIVLISERRDGDKVVGYNVLSVTPDAFRNFLRNWFEFLSGTKTSPSAARQILQGDDKAAA